MKIDFPAGLILVQASQKSTYRPGQFGALLSIEWVGNTYVFMIGWPDATERTKLEDLGDLAIIPIASAIALLNRVPPAAEATLDELKAARVETGNIVKIFDGYFRDMLKRHSDLGERIAEMESNGHS